MSQTQHEGLIPKPGILDANPAPEAEEGGVDGSCGLADELWVGIFSWLDSASVAKAGAVCPRWYRLSRDPSLWTELRLCLRSRDKLTELARLFNPRRVHLTKHARSLAIHKTPDRCGDLLFRRDLQEAIALACPHLEELTLDGLYTSTAAVAEGKALRLKRLVCRSPQGYITVPDVGTRVEELEELAMEGGLVPADLGEICGLTQLRHLRIVGKNQQHKAALLRMPVELGRSLRSLSLLGCQTDREWQASLLALVAEHCQRLEHLGLSLCPARPPSPFDPPHHLPDKDLRSLSQCRLRSLTLHSEELCPGHQRNVREALRPLAASPSLRRVLVLGMASLPPFSVSLPPSLDLHFRASNFR